MSDVKNTTTCRVCGKPISDTEAVATVAIKRAGAKRATQWGQVHERCFLFHIGDREAKRAAIRAMAESAKAAA